MIEKIQMFGAHCDNCKEPYLLSNDAYAMESVDSIKEQMGDSDWASVDNKDYCYRCYKMDEDGSITLNESRFKE